MVISLDESTESRKLRADWTRRVPEVTLLLWICRATRSRTFIEEIASQALITYPRSFVTTIDGKRVPDLALLLLTLNEAKKRKWGYVAGGWVRGWRLTRKGVEFAKDIERRARERKSI
jgi:hypothetical protein